MVAGAGVVVVPLSGRGGGEFGNYSRVWIDEGMDR